MGVMLDSSRVSWPEIDAASGVIAVLPVGALEQHGPHLPLDTDTVLATGVARRIATEIGGWLLPAIGYGEAWTAEDWPGTISLTAETLQRTIENIARGVKRIGCVGLVTVNGHFGNRAPIARARLGLPALHLDYPGLEAAAAEFCTSTPAGDGFYHADEVETSMMLALAPEAVRMDKAVAEYPAFPPEFGRAPMQLRTFASSGVFGDPRPATAATGEKIIARVVAESVHRIEAWRQAL
jgi:creatinine amidohydrolase